ncbi:MAG: CidA/LrgA family protein [Lactobacillales bacterium]|jgi:holin-like protein|nr:CidA/LrgA family protein [Lactobacillales bacterium]
MKIYKEVLIILVFSFLGEIISKLSGLPVPGSVIGMVLLFAALMTKVVKVRQVENVGKFLLENLTILFVPAGIGLMLHFDVILRHWALIIIIIAVTTILAQGVIALTVQKIKRKFEPEASACSKSDEKIAQSISNLDGLEETPNV